MFFFFFLWACGLVVLAGVTNIAYLLTNGSRVTVAAEVEELRKKQAQSSVICGRLRLGLVE